MTNICSHHIPITHDDNMSIQTQKVKTNSTRPAKKPSRHFSATYTK